MRVAKRIRRFNLSVRVWLVAHPSPSRVEDHGSLGASPVAKLVPRRPLQRTSFPCSQPVIGDNRKLPLRGVRCRKRADIAPSARSFAGGQPVLSRKSQEIPCYAMRAESPRASPRRHGPCFQTWVLSSQREARRAALGERLVPRGSRHWWRHGNGAPALPDRRWLASCASSIGPDGSPGGMVD